MPAAVRTALLLAALWVVGSGAGAGTRSTPDPHEAPLLPAFSEDEQAYQKRAWEALIGCAVARHMSAALFSEGSPFPSEDGTCRAIPPTEGSGVDGSGGRDGTVAVAGDEATCSGASVRVDGEHLREHCAQFSGVFAQQCARVSQAIVGALKKKKTDKKTKATRAKFDAAIRRSGVCRGGGASSTSQSTAHNGAIAAGGGCRERGDCSIHSPLSDLVVKGNLTLVAGKRGGAAATDAIPPIVHLMFGMTPDWGGKPFGLVHYLCVKSARAQMPTATIFFYYRYESKGKWWKRAKKLVRPVQVCPSIVLDTTRRTHDCLELTPAALFVCGTGGPRGGDQRTAHLSHGTCVGFAAAAGAARFWRDLHGHGRHHGAAVCAIDDES